MHLLSLNKSIYIIYMLCCRVCMLCAETVHDEWHMHSPSLQTPQSRPSLQSAGARRQDVHMDQEADHCCTTCTASCLELKLRGMPSVPSEQRVWECQYKYSVQVSSTAIHWHDTCIDHQEVRCNAIGLHNGNVSEQSGYYVTRVDLQGSRVSLDNSRPAACLPASFSLNLIGI